jgi:hypothetical protein
MTPAQRFKYFAEAKKAITAMRERGHTGSDETLRHQLTVEALGENKSSNAFSNEDLDRVLAVLWSHSDPGDLMGQLAQLDQPIARLQWLCQQHLRAAGIEEKGVEWYLLGIGRKMFPGRPAYFLSTFSEAEWRDILVACNKHRLRADKRKLAGAPF